MRVKMIYGYLMLPVVGVVFSIVFYLLFEFVVRSHKTCLNESSNEYGFEGVVLGGDNTISWLVKYFHIYVYVMIFLLFVIFIMMYILIRKVDCERPK